MNWEILGTDDLSRWETYHDRLPETGPYHDPRYLALLEGNFEFDAERVELFAYEDGAATVYYPYFRRPLSTGRVKHPEYDLNGLSDIVSSWYYGGPLYAGPSDARERVAGAFAETFSKVCRDRGVIAEFVRFDPNLRNDRTFEVLEPTFNRETVPVDLSKSRDRIWEEYDSSNRTHIRQGREAGFAVTPATDAGEISAFHDIYAAAMDAKGASKHYRFARSFFEDLVLGTDNLATLLCTRHDAEIAGGSLLIHANGTACEFLRASEPDLWDDGLNNHLCHRAVVHCHERGLDRLDFQGGRPGVFQFKKSFSPERGELHLARRVHDQPVYENLVAAAADQGVDTNSSYFPAYRVEQSN